MASTRRRFFMKIAGGSFFMRSIPSSILGFFSKVLPVRTVEKERFKFNKGKGQIEWESGAKTEYRLIVDGMVENSICLSYEDLCSLPRVEQISDFHCVEGWSVSDLKWGGFRFREILNRARPLPKASYVLFHSFGSTGTAPRGQSHYIESLPLSDLLDPKMEILLALTLDGKPLPEDYGAPLRLVSPYDLGYKSIKFLSCIEFIEKERPGWWTLANPIYPTRARVPANRLRKKR